MPKRKAPAPIAHPVTLEDLAAGIAKVVAQIGDLSGQISIHDEAIGSLRKNFKSVNRILPSLVAAEIGKKQEEPPLGSGFLAREAAKEYRATGKITGGQRMEPIQSESATSGASYIRTSRAIVDEARSSSDKPEPIFLYLMGRIETLAFEAGRNSATINSLIASQVLGESEARSEAGVDGQWT